MIKQLSEAMTNFCRANFNHKPNLPIRSSEMGVLILIKEKAKDTGVRLVEISDYFDIQKSSVSTIIKSLDKKGYIYKTTLSTDKRSAPLFPTEKGIALVNETIQEYQKIARLLVDEFGENKCCEFIEMLEKTTKIIHMEGEK